MFHGTTLQESKLAKQALAKRDFAAWSALDSWTTASDLSVHDPLHHDVANYVYMALDAINDPDGEIPTATRIGNIIRSEMVTVDGYLTRGVPVYDQSLTGIDAAHLHAETLSSHKDQRLLSFSRMPRIAYAFSQGVRKIYSAETQWTRYCYGKQSRVGFVIAAQEVSGYHLAYSSRNVFDQEQELEAEVLVEASGISVTEVLTGRQSVFGLPTIVVRGEQP